MPESKRLDRRPGSTRAFRISSAVLLVLLLAALIGYVPMARRYAAGHVFITESNKPITLTATAGEQVVLGVRLRGTLNHAWAVPTGLRVNLTGQQPAPLVAPATPGWENVITSSESNDSTDDEIAGTFTIPDTGGRTGSIEGNIDGTVEYATATATGFKNASLAVNVPLKITMEPRGGWFPVTTGQLLNGVVWVCIALAVALLGCGLIAFSRAAPQADHSVSEWGWAVIFGLIVGAGFLFGGLVLENELTPHDHDVALPAITAPERLFPSVLGAAAALAVAALSLRIGTEAEARIRPAGSR
jgi:hypothetical protein